MQKCKIYLIFLYPVSFFDTGLLYFCRKVVTLSYNKKINTMANKLSNYIWLFDTILNNKRISLKEIGKKWEQSEYYDGKKLSRSTFNRWKESAEDIFDINIECEEKGQYCYYIEDNEKINKANDVRVWLLDHYHISSILNSSMEIRDKIITENIPSARNFLQEITDAIKKDSAVEFIYKKFGAEDSQEEKICGIPLCLKQYKQRWYVLLQKDTNELRIYGLDRISKLELTKLETPIKKRKINTNSYWDNYYGIFTSQDNKPIDVKLKVSSRYTKFLRSLPLHHSQKEVETSADYSIFTYFISVERDFISEIISNGTDIEVLEPQSLREDITKTIREMLGKYEG